jgi:hypothetical protein
VSDDDVAKSLSDALADEGEHVDDGTFTLDAAGAFRKLREHQLADPHGYLLLLVEAAWLAAEQLDRGEVRIVPGQATTVSFSGVALEPGSLHGLFQAALGSFDRLEGEARRRARVLQLLGLAANNALALRPKQIIIETGDANGNGHRLSIDPSGATTVEPSGSAPPCWVRFTFSGALLTLGMRLGRMSAVLWLDRMATECQVLERCRYTRLAVLVDGDLISQRCDTDSAWDQPSSVPVMLDGREIGCIRSRSAARTWIVNRGIAINDPHCRWPGLQVIVEVDLPMDLARAQLLQGPQLEAVRQAIRDAQARRWPTRG